MYATPSKIVGLHFGAEGDVEVDVSVVTSSTDGHKFVAVRFGGYIDGITLYMSPSQLDELAVELAERSERALSEAGLVSVTVLPAKE